MSKEFVDAVESGDHLGAEKSFNDTMAQKVGDSLEAIRRDLANSFINYKDQEADVNEKDWGVYKSTVVEKDEHKRTKEYKRLSPKMKDAVDEIFRKMEVKPSDFLNTFDKTIKDVSKKFKVSDRELLKYFEREMLSV